MNSEETSHIAKDGVVATGQNVTATGYPILGYHSQRSSLQTPLSFYTHWLLEERDSQFMHNDNPCYSLFWIVSPMTNIINQ